MIVMKFGGTSMGSSVNIKNVADIVLKAKRKPIVVVSAMTGVTNMLLEASSNAISKKSFASTKNIVKKIKEKHNKTASELVSDKAILSDCVDYIDSELDHLENFLEALSFIKELTPTSYDKIVAIGEKLSAKLLASHIKNRGKKSEYVNLEQVIQREHKRVDNAFYVTLEKRMNEKITSIMVDQGAIPVCTGFFGKIPGGIISAVGRGYSDFCAAILGSAFKVKEIQIWTDVDGIMSADPRVVDKAVILDEVSFNEAAEMSSFGAKVIHPQTIWPAVKRNIPVCIKNTMNPIAKGTLITQDGKLSNRICKAITAKKGINIITIMSSQMPNKHGYMRSVLEIFDKYEISIDIIATSEIAVSFSIERSLKDLDVKHALIDLKKFGKVLTAQNQAIVACIGNEMGERIGSGSSILKSIASQGLNASVISRNALKTNISCVIEEKMANEVVKTLHKDILES
ncbi:MAG: aspartate kinase [Candidatus Gracilibacteria bacterium]|jgi:aspartate kinase|nr:aspartate kinase [Candidatus Gracilibacteria bacterium]